VSERESWRRGGKETAMYVISQILTGREGERERWEQRGKRKEDVGAGRCKRDNLLDGTALRCLVRSHLDCV
jgi:hypothetical protein